MADTINDQEKKELRLTFDLFDDSGTGFIAPSHVAALLRAIGEYPSEATIKSIVTEVNAKTGVVSFEDFLLYVLDVRKKHKRLSVTDVEQALNVFNVSGKVEMHELQRYLTTLGERLSESEMRAFMDIAQVDEDGHVDCARLARALMS